MHERALAGEQCNSRPTCAAQLYICIYIKVKSVYAYLCCSQMPICLSRLFVPTNSTFVFPFAILPFFLLLYNI